MTSQTDRDPGTRVPPLDSTADGHRSSATASRIQSGQAPVLEGLRPLKATESATFPVYPNLPAVLADAQRHPDPDVQFALAVCSGYAYGDAPTLSMMMTRLGLVDSPFFTASQYVDAMLIDVTAHLLQSADGRVVIVAYRGTVPMSGISWLNDLDVNTQRVRLRFPDDGDTYNIHGGFYRNVRATRPDIIERLEQARQGKSVRDGQPMPNPMEALYITGHSYGGAMATLLAVMLRSEPAYEPLLRLLRAVYTYGAPMVGSPAFADACQQEPAVGPKLFRYMYNNDIVPQLPPRASGDFKHFGTELRYSPGADAWTESREPVKQLHGLSEVLAAPLTFLAPQLRWTRRIPLTASLYDHLPGGYITALTPEDKREITEFGS